MNINDPSAIQECTSCQMCGAVCPHQAITIRQNEDGFYRPYVDETICTNCGLCTKVCYKFDADVKMTSAEDGSRTKVFSAQNLSDEVLRKVTSGGVADALAKKLIKDGYVCIGVSYNDEKHRAEHIVASTSTETDDFRGSKYIQSYSEDVFKELVKNVRTTKYAVFGLPCQIYALDKYLNIRSLRDNNILIALFCHGCPSMFVWNKYEKQIKAKVGNKPFDDVQFRSKAKGWGKYHVAVYVDGERVFLSNPKNDEFNTLFFSDQVLNEACSDCKLRSTLEYSDIRLGDFWSKRFLNDKKGVSLVAISSERGIKAFNAIKDQFIVGEHDTTEMLVHQSYGRIYHPDKDLRMQIINSLRDESQSLKKAVGIYESKQGIGYKVKKLIRFIDWYFPFNLTGFLKRFV